MIADYPPFDGNSPGGDRTVIGKTKTNSKAFCIPKEPCSTYREHAPAGRFKEHHIYKTLKLTTPKEFSKDEYDLLRLLFGQSTICETHLIDAHTVERIYKGKTLPNKVESLHPTQLELLCQEYLRRFPEQDIPKLEYLVNPIGNQIKDIDIVGSDANGILIFCQVSQMNDKNKVAEKIGKLESQKGDGRVLVYFGPKQSADKRKLIKLVDIHTVFRRMNSIHIGRRMLNSFLMRNRRP